jgi:hypothetical protein
MMNARLAIFSTGIVALVATTVVACGGSPTVLAGDATSPEEAQAITQASTVAIDLKDAKGSSIGSCSGTLISADLVLTAGHCVVSAKKFKVTAASGKASTSTLAVTTWKDFQSDFSHPHHADVALIRLDDPIELEGGYPTVSPAAVKPGTKAYKIARSAPDEGATKDSVTLSPGSEKGFRFTYAAGTSASGSFLDTGGAVMSADGKIVGIVSGRGRTSGNLYVARVDLFAKWIASAQTCTSSDLKTQGWGGDNPWGGGGGGSSSGWTGTYGGKGADIDAGSLAPLPGDESGSGSLLPDSGTGTSSGGSTSGGVTPGESGSCPPTPSCVGSDCQSGGTGTTPGGTAPNPNGDDDGDGIVNSQDPLPKVPGKPGDRDGDGILDGQDPLPDVPGKPGDMDGDGVADGVDPLPKIPGKPGDRDGDGIPDSKDSQPDVPNGGAPGTDVCPGEEACPSEPDGASCSGPNCGGCSGQAGCVDEQLDFGNCACAGNLPSLR